MHFKKLNGEEFIWLKAVLLFVMLLGVTACGSDESPVSALTATRVVVTPDTSTPVSPPTPEATRPTATSKSKRTYRCDEIVDISLTSNETGWAVVNCWASVGNRTPTTGFVYHLADGEWQLVADAPDIAGPYACYTGVSAVSDNEMWAIGLQDGVYVCQDTPWLIHYLDGEWEVFDIEALVGSDSSPYTTGLYSIDMVDSEYGWAGGNGAIFKYEKGIWSIDLKLPEDRRGSRFLTISMASLDAGWAWAWSQNGSFFSYQDNSWIPWKDFTFDNGTIVTDIASVDVNEAWAVGYRGDSVPGYFRYIPRLWHYIDGYWQEAELPIEEGALQSIKMTDDNEGWITGGVRGEDSVMLHYTNGQWQNVSSPTNAAVLSIDATTPDNVWIGAERFYRYLSPGDWHSVDILSIIE